MNADEALRILASHGLAGSSTRSIQVDSLDQLLSRADARRILGPVWAAVAAGRVENATEAWRDSVAARHRSATVTTMASHAALREVLGRLAGAQIEVRVLKGCASAVLDYAGPTERFTSDVDLLVRDNQFQDALECIGGVAQRPPVRTAWERRYEKAATTQVESGVHVDLHRRIAQGYFGLRIPEDELWGHRERLAIGDQVAWALDGPGRLLHEGLHVAVSNQFGLHSARDIPQLVLSGAVDWEVAIDRAGRWGIDGLFAVGVLRAWAEFDVGNHPLVDWADRLRVSGRQGLALKISQDRARGHVITAPLALPVWRWPGYVLPLLVPSKRFVADQGETRRARLRGIVDELRRE